MLKKEELDKVLDKVRSLTDLIEHVKKHRDSVKKEESIAKADTVIVQAEPRDPNHTPQILSPKVIDKKPKYELEHLGFEHDIPGVQTHLIGIKGGDKKYKLDYNIEHKKQGLPAYTVVEVDASNQLKSKSPKIFKELKHAVHDIVDHHTHGKWSDDAKTMEDFFKSVNKSLTETKETLRKAKEDKLIPAEQRGAFREEKRKMDKEHPDVIQGRLTGKPGTSDIGIEVRRGSKQNPESAISPHGYARIFEPSVHAKVAKKLVRKMVDHLKNQPKPNLPKSEEMEKADNKPKPQSYHSKLIQENRQVKARNQEKALAEFKNSQQAKTKAISEQPKLFDPRLSTMKKAEVKAIPDQISEPIIRNRIDYNEPKMIQSPNIINNKDEDKSSAIQGKKVNPQSVVRSLLGKMEVKKEETLFKPYHSEQQRKWAHTEAGKKALGGESKVAEWDKESKGKHLPQKVEKAKVEENKSDKEKQRIRSDRQQKPFYESKVNPKDPILNYDKITPSKKK